MNDRQLDGQAWKTMVQQLGLQAHPEGGYYREVFRSVRHVYDGTAQRSAGTSIYYLLADGAYSAWHRIDAEEIWYFHAGDALALHVLQPDGTLLTHQLGNPLRHEDAVFQVCVQADCWFAAEVVAGGEFSLVSCAVMPGFEFSGFELASDADLAAAAARHGEWLRRLLKR